MRNLATLFLAVIVGIAASCPSWAESKRERTLPNSIIAIIPYDSPPTYYRDQKRGKPTGFAVDVMDTIGRRAGLRVDYIFANNWTEITRKIETGKADLCPGIGITEERQGHLAFTSPIDAFPVSFFVRSGAGRIDQLEGIHKVGVVRGSVAYENLKIYKSLSLIPYESFERGLFDLLAGQIDAFACPAPTFLQLARKSGVEDKIKIAGKPITEIKRAIAVSRNNHMLIERLNSAIAGFVGGPEYQRIYERWYGHPKPYWTTSRILSYCIIFVLILVGGMLVFRHIAIRRFNRELIAEIEKRKQAEEALRKAHDELDRKVDERTYELWVANDKLEHKIEKQKIMENALRESAKALKESEQRYHSLFDQSPDGILLIDTSVKIVEFNEAAHRQLGYSREEYAALSLSDIDPVESDAETRARIEKILREGQSEFDVKHRTKHGELRDVHVITQAITLSGKQVLHAIWHDITERKRAEEAIIQSEKRFRALFDNTALGIAIVDINRHFVDCNPAFQKMLGYSLEELRNMTVPQVSLAEDDMKSRAYYTAMMDGRTDSFSMEKRHIRKDRTILWTNLTGTLIRDEENRPYLLFGIVEDIADRKMAEESAKLDERRMSAILRISQSEAGSLKELLNFTLEEAISLSGSRLGYIYYYDEDKEEFVLHSWSSAVMQECTIAEPQAVYQLAKTGIWGEAVRQRRPIVVNDFTAPNPLKKGYPRGHAELFRYFTIPVFSDNRIVAVVGVANKSSDYTDSDVQQLTLLMASVWKIADRKQTEEMIRASLKEKEILLKEIHHRVKNNLQVVTSMLNLQAKYIKDPEARIIFDESQQRVETMSLIHEKLYRAKDLSGIDFKEYVDELVKNLLTLNTGKSEHIAVKLDIEGVILDVNSAIPCGLIINELVSNALKHAFPDGLKGYIGVRMSRDSAGRIGLSVSDDGIGFPQGLNFRNTESLGMQLIMALVNQLGGAIELDRSEGTSFKIAFRT